MGLPGLPQSSDAGPFPPAGFVRHLDVRALAERVFGDSAKAEGWLNRPNKSLSGQRPADLLKDDLGAAVVRETLEQIDHGIFA
jgi:putative toxin-antitoxin system antitoxin component (TIGR02293 family)